MSGAGAGEADEVPVEAAARACGVPPTWVRARVEAGLIPSRRVKAYRMVRVADVRALAATRGQVAVGEVPEVADPEALVTTREAALALGVSAKTIGDWALKGRFPVRALTKRGGRPEQRYRLGDVRDVAARMRGAPGHERMSKGHRPPGLGGGPFPEDTVGCPHPPGSEGRLRTYERRVAAGLAVFCRLDAKRDAT